jgi:hypothetical protein
VVLELQLVEVVLSVVGLVGGGVEDVVVDEPGPVVAQGISTM